MGEACPLEAPVILRQPNREWATEPTEARRWWPVLGSRCRGGQKEPLPNREPGFWEKGHQHREDV